MSASTGGLNLWDSGIARISVLSQDLFLCVAYGTGGEGKAQQR